MENLSFRMVIKCHKGTWSQIFKLMLIKVSHLEMFQDTDIDNDLIDKIPKMQTKLENYVTLRSSCTAKDYSVQ